MTDLSPEDRKDVLDAYQDALLIVITRAIGAAEARGEDAANPYLAAPGQGWEAEAWSHAYQGALFALQAATAPTEH